jgi:hypothetical protein
LLPAVPIGIHPEREGRISPVAENVIEGRYLEPDDEDVMLISQGMDATVLVEAPDETPQLLRWSMTAEVVFESAESN